MNEEQKKAAGQRMKEGRERKKLERELEDSPIEPRQRLKRIPLGVPVSKLAIKKRDGYHRHWMNDNGARIQQAEQAGYQFVEKESLSGTAQKGLGTKVSQIVGTKEDGTPLTAYLMEIKQEWYDEDQSLMQAEVDKVDEAIKTGNVSGTVGEDGRYIPKEGIKVK